MNILSTIRAWVANEEPPIPTPPTDRLSPDDLGHSECGKCGLTHGPSTPENPIRYDPDTDSLIESCVRCGYQMRRPPVKIERSNGMRAR